MPTLILAKILSLICLMGFCRSQSGATSIEYGLISCVIITSIAVIILAISPEVIGKFQSVVDSFRLRPAV
jgi:Flp pilus assembly pilin Flp